MWHIVFDDFLILIGGIGIVVETTLTSSTKGNKSVTNTRIYTVIVLYNCKLSQSSSFATLSEAAKVADQKLRILIYDNSNFASEKNNETNNVIIDYIHNPINPGICEAYNVALEKAYLLGYEWLLVLDQDSELEPKYIKKTLRILNSNLEGDAVAINPLAYNKSQKLVSPARWICSKVLPFKNVKIMQPIECKNMTSVNSGMFVNVNYLKEIGGYNKAFPLDMLDHWLMWKISRDKKYVFISNAILKHNLSCSDLANVTYERHQNIIRSGLKLYSRIGLTPFFVFFLGSIYRAVLLSITQKDLRFLKLWQYFKNKEAL